MRVLIPRLIGGALCLVIGLSEAAGKVFRAEELENCQFVVRKIVCTYDQSVYHIRTPVFADPNYQIPVVVILHDAGGNGASIIDDERLIEAFVDKGYAVLAPNALPRGNRRIHYRGERPGMVEAQKTLHPGRFSKKKFLMANIDGTIRYLKYKEDTGWYFYNVDQAVYYSIGRGPKADYIGRDEIQALRNVLAHAAEEYGVDPKPVLVIGLGHGGSLVWQIACYAPKFGQILAPVGGAFWRKIPKNCNSGAHLVHTHHRASAFWPLEGVTGNKRRYTRTNIYRNLDMLLSKNRCGPDKTTARNDEVGVNHTTWADCPGGGPVEFMVLDEKFAFQTWWLDEMLDRVERTDIERTPEAPEVPLEIGPVVKVPGAETGFVAPGAGIGFKTLGAGTGFKTLGTGTGFKTLGTGTGFKTPGTGTGSRFKRAK